MVRHPGAGRFGAPVVAVLLTVGTLLGLLAAAPVAGAASGVQVRATIDGRAVRGSSAAHPIRLHPGRPANVDLEVTNRGTTPVTVRTVTLSGSVVGLTFFSYQTSVSLTLGGGQSTHLRYALDLSGLDGQATGLIPARVTLTDARHHQVASQAFVSDVRGSLNSVYGLFGLALLGLTAVAIAGLVWAVATHRMPRNRWGRALRVLTVGLGLGLVLMFSMSALRVWVPSPGRWAVVLLAFAVGSFGLGYLTPTPSSEEDDEVVDEAEFAAPAPPPEPVPANAATTDGGAP